MSDYIPCDCKYLDIAPCPLADIRRARTNPAGAMEAYREELRKRAGVRDQSLTPAETDYHAQRCGAPAPALAVLRGVPEERVALDGAKKFVASPRSLIWWLLLIGEPGRGKTVAATHVLREFCRRYPWNELPTGSSKNPAMFIRAGALTRTSDFDKLDQAWLSSLIAAELLVVDDAGDEGHATGLGALVDVLLARDEKQRRTVLTGNLTGPAFAKRYGESLASKIQAHGIIPNLSAEKSMRQARRQ